MTEYQSTPTPSNTSFEMPADQPSEASKPRSNSVAGGLWELFQVLVLAVLMVTLIRNFVQNYRIDGLSMEPNFHDGQFLIVNRFAYCPGIYLEVPLVNQPLFEKRWCTTVPTRGDVVIFEYPRDPSRDFIKRVIGLPGETVEIRSGAVYINGTEMPQPFGPNPGSYSADPIVVGSDEVYVMGDNRNNSSDSHLWGPLKQELIIGEALVSYWPPQNWSLVPQYNLTDLTAYAETP